MDPSLGFEAPELCLALNQAPADALDALPYGVIGFDHQGAIARYNAYESRCAQFSPADVLGQDVFVELAPCLNNYLVAGRFDEAQSAGVSLDQTLPYVLTFRMKPTRVTLRLLAQPGQALRFVLVVRQNTP